MGIRAVRGLQSGEGRTGILPSLAAVVFLWGMAASGAWARQEIGPTVASPAAIASGPGALLITRSRYVIEPHGGMARVTATFAVRTLGDQRPPPIALFRGEEVAVEEFEDPAGRYHLMMQPDPAGTGPARLELISEPGAAMAELKILLQLPLRRLGEKVHLSMHVPEVPMTHASFRFETPPRQLEVPLALRPPALTPAPSPTPGTPALAEYVVPLVGSGILDASWEALQAGTTAAPVGSGDRWRLSRSDTLVQIDPGEVRGVGRYVLETISGPVSELEVEVPAGTRLSHRGHPLLEDEVMTRPADEVRVIRFLHPFEGTADLEVDWARELPESGLTQLPLPRFRGAQFRAVGSLAISNPRPDRVKVTLPPDACLDPLEPAELPGDAFRDPRLPMDSAYRQECGDLVLALEKSGPTPAGARGRARVMEVTARFPEEKQERVRYQARLVLEPGFRGDLRFLAPTTDWKLDQATMGGQRVELAQEDGGYRVALGHPGSWPAGREPVVDLEFSELASSNGRLGRLFFHLPRLDVPVDAVRLTLREPEGLQLHGMEGSFDQCLPSHGFFLRTLAEDLRRGLAITGQGVSPGGALLALLLLAFQVHVIRSYLTRRMTPTMAAAGTGLVLVLALGVAIGRRPPTLVGSPGISEAIDLFYGRFGGSDPHDHEVEAPIAPGPRAAPPMALPATSVPGAQAGETGPALPVALPAPAQGPGTDSTPFVPAGTMSSNESITSPPEGVTAAAPAPAPVAASVPGAAAVPAGTPPAAGVRVFTRSYTPGSHESSAALTLAISYAVPSIEYVMKIMGAFLGLLLFVTLFCSLRELASPSVLAAATLGILLVTWMMGLWFPAIHRSFALGFTGPALLMAFLKVTSRAREQLEAWKEEGERAHLERHHAMRRGRTTAGPRSEGGGDTEPESDDPLRYSAIPHARPANQVPIQEALAVPPEEEDEITFIVEEEGHPSPAVDGGTPPPADEAPRKEEPES